MTDEKTVEKMKTFTCKNKKVHVTFVDEDGQKKRVAIVAGENKMSKKVFAAVSKCDYFKALVKTGIVTLPDMSSKDVSEVETKFGEKDSKKSVVTIGKKKSTKADKK